MAEFRHLSTTKAIQIQHAFLLMKLLFMEYQASENLKKGISLALMLELSIKALTATRQEHFLAEKFPKKNKNLLT